VEQPRIDPRGLLVAVAVRPGSKVRVWCETVGNSSGPEVLRKLEAGLTKVRPISVRNGPIAFALAGPQGGQAASGPPENAHAKAMIKRLEEKK
jgi:hypothetical protein